MVARVPGFHVAGQPHTVDELVRALDRGVVDLVILDHGLAGDGWSGLLRRIHDCHSEVDVVMVADSGHPELVREAVRSGVTQYLIKPFGYQALCSLLESYRRLRGILRGEGEMSPDEIQAVFGPLRAPGPSALPPKGYSKFTAELILDALARAEGPASAQQVAAHAGVSRSTAQRYLKRFEISGRVRLTLKYGEGRPEHYYSTEAG